MKEEIHILDNSKRWGAQVVRSWITKGYLWYVCDFALYPGSGVEVNIRITKSLKNWLVRQWTQVRLGARSSINRGARPGLREAAVELEGDRF